MCVRERCSREFLPQPRRQMQFLDLMRSLAYLSFDFLFRVFCSRISQRSLFWTSDAQPYHRAPRTRTHEWKTEKWEKSKMDETGSFGCFDDSFFHLACTVRGRYTFSSTKIQLFRWKRNAKIYLMPAARFPVPHQRRAIWKNFFCFQRSRLRTVFKLLLLFFLSK